MSLRAAVLAVCALLSACSDRPEREDTELLARANELFASLNEAESVEQANRALEEIVGLTSQGLDNASPAERRAELHLMRANAHLALDRPLEALHDVDEAIGLVPAEPGLWALRAYIHDLLDERHAAIHDLDRVLELDPNYAGVRGNRAVLLMEIGEYSDAIGDLEAAIEQEPEREDLFELRGDAWQLLGDFDPAMADYRRAMQLAEDTQTALFGSDTEGYDPDDLRLRMKIAAVHEARDEVSDARAQYDAILSAEPNHEDAQRALERLAQ